jgi:hypothetical protein
MLRLVCAWFLLSAGVVPLASASSEGRQSVGFGLSVVAPQGWHVSKHPVTVCGNPTQRFVATTGHLKLHAGLRIPRRSALVLLMEGSTGRFPARPALFSLPGHFGNLGGCCKIPTGPARSFSSATGVGSSTRLSTSETGRRPRRDGTSCDC